MKLNRQILLIRGPQRFEFLDDLLTMKIEPGMPMRYGALLSPQGKILFDVFVSSEEDELILDLPSSEYAQALQKFQLYKMRAKLEFIEDPRAVRQIAGAGDPRGAVGQRVYGDAKDWDEGEYRQARIAALVPEFGVDFGAGEAYPREWRFDEMGGVDYRKGCFVGQEIVARMRHKTDLRKSLRRVSSQDPLQTGASVFSDEKDIGKILSSNDKTALAFLQIKSLNPKTLRTNSGALTLED